MKLFPKMRSQPSATAVGVRFSAAVCRMVAFCIHSFSPGCGYKKMNQEKLESARNRLFIALGIDIAVSVGGVFASLSGAGTLRDIAAGTIAADPATLKRLGESDVVFQVGILTTIAVGLLLVSWLKSCYSYAKEVIGASGFKNEAWTTSGWLVPVFNMFKPYQIIKEIYKAGTPDYAIPDGWQKKRGSLLLLAWWIFWVLAHLILISLSSVRSKPEQNQLVSGGCSLNLVVVGLQGA